MGPSLLVATLLGCAGDPGHAIVLTGWQYEWETLSHRVGYLRADVAQDSSLSLGLIGGDWSTGESASDTPHYRVRYAEVTAEDVAFAEGNAVFTMGPEPEASVTVRVPNAPEGKHLTAFIQGFFINCDTPQSDEYPADYPSRYGYTSNGFGFALGNPVRDGTDVDVPVEATVRWGPQDRTDMNAAIPYAVTEVGIHVLLVASALEPEGTTITGAAAYPFEPPYSPQPPMTATADLDGRGADGFFGWTAWRLDGNLDGADAGEGDYLRAMGVEAVPSADDRRAVTAETTATISSSSVLELTQFTAGFEGELVRIGSPLAEVTHYAVTGSHPVGPAETATTLDE